MPKNVKPKKLPTQTEIEESWREHLGKIPDSVIIETMHECLKATKLEFRNNKKTGEAVWKEVPDFRERRMAAVELAKIKRGLPRQAPELKDQVNEQTDFATIFEKAITNDEIFFSIEAAYKELVNQRDEVTVDPIE